jgi:hypothetical protein
MRELTDMELDAVCGAGLVTITNVGKVKLNLAVPTVAQTIVASQVGVALGGANSLTAAALNLTHMHL